MFQSGHNWTSFPWQDAIQFPGAWDYGWIRQFLLERGIPELIPANALLENDTDEIRAAGTREGMYLIYLPHSTKVILDKKLVGYAAWAIDLETRRTACVEYHMEAGKTIVEMHPFRCDALLVLEQA